MILLTIGTQLPFDRLLKMVDQILNEYPLKVIGQVGESEFIPKNFEYRKTLTREDFSKLFNESEFVISHAGMGTILNALTLNKPIIVVPREVKYSEHRNNHQLATVNNISHFDNVFVAYDKEGIIDAIAKIKSGLNIEKTDYKNRNELVKRLSNAISEMIQR